MNVNYKKSAFTLSEVLITIAILGVIISLTTVVVKEALPDFDVYKVKKINTTFKDTVNTMLNEDSQYEGKHDFSNTGMVDTSIGALIDTRSFRKVFAKYIKIKDEFKCYAYKAGNIENCYMSIDGTVWAIPNTNFVEEASGSDIQQSVVVELPNKTGGTSLYAPVTIYPKYEKKKLEKDRLNANEYMRKNAIIYGVRRDGKVILLTEGYDCKNNDNDKRTMQCIAINNVASAKVKKRGSL